MNIDFLIVYLAENEWDFCLRYENSQYELAIWRPEWAKSDGLECPQWKEKHLHMITREVANYILGLERK